MSARYCLRKQRKHGHNGKNHPVSGEGLAVFGIIYKATGPAGRVYIGQTIKSLVRRKSGHKVRALKQDRRYAFGIALLNEGFDKFTWEEIDQAENQVELDQKEKQWIAHYKSNDTAYGYNSTDGGISHAPWNKGKHGVYSGESLKRMSESQRGRHVSAETRAKIREARARQVITAETGRKISQANRGKKMPPRSEETRKKISQANRGKHHSTETKRKLSEMNKGRIPWNKGKHRGDKNNPTPGDAV